MTDEQFLAEPPTLTAESLHELHKTLKRHDGWMGKGFIGGHPQTPTPILRGNIIRHLLLDETHQAEDAINTYAMQLGCMYGRSPKNPYLAPKTWTNPLFDLIGHKHNPELFNFNKQEKETMVNFRKYEVVEIRGRVADEMSDDQILNEIHRINEEIKRRSERNIDSVKSKEKIASLKVDVVNIIDYLDNRDAKED